LAVERQIADLFALPREEFTAARNALAAELKRGGDADAAARVKGLAKPTAAAAALNRVAREEPQLVRKLLAAGTELRRAQVNAVSGTGAEKLRDAMAAQRALVRELVAAVEQRGKASRAVLDQVQRTLEAAAIDPEAGELLAQGRLTKDLAVSGFPAGLLGEVKRAAPARKDDELRRLRAQLQAAKAELKQVRQETRTRERAVEQARRELVRRERDRDQTAERERQLTAKVRELEQKA
jgi:hypothetical protein